MYSVVVTKQNCIKNRYNDVSIITVWRGGGGVSGGDPKYLTRRVHESEVFKRAMN